MGKRKQKVRWSSVDGISWSNAEQDESPDLSAGPVKADSGEGGTRRSSAQGWTSSLAPRFERKAAAEQKHIYYEGEFCEAEDLPNGFTKIRSKNLDILFKRDYYEQRLAVQQQISEQLLKVKSTEIEEDSENPETVNPECETDQVNPTDSMPESDSADKSCAWTFDKIDPNDIPEFKPSDSAMDPGEIESGHTSPFYVNHLPQEYEAPPQPNLYLYTPSNNTLIPCEEIIIPNPVMSPEGPVYSGPTNIYLAYPVQGPDGRGYITQPFTPPGSYISQGSSSYSPSIVYEGSNCYSSTPQTPNSGEDSGSSTQPASPPIFESFHPTTWSRDLCHSKPLAPDLEGYYDPLPSKVPTSSESKQAAPYIPGLPLQSTQPAQKKTQKRRKKKSKVESSTMSSDSSNTDSDFVKICPDTTGYNQHAEESEYLMEAPAQQIHEIHLTDDLADSLVNPPTDQEDIILDQSPLSEKDAQDETCTDQSETEILGGNIPDLQLVQPDDLNEREIQADKEICEITDNIDGMKSVTIIAGVICNSEKNATENAQHESVKDVDVLKQEVNSFDEQKTSLDQNSNIEYSVDECKNEETQMKSKNQQRKNKNSKKGKKVPLISTNAVQQSKEDVCNLTESKMSYSSVTKSNLVEESKPMVNVPCPPQVESVPIPSPLPSIPICLAPQSTAEEDSDKWEKVPLSVSKHENWEKTSKKRKHKNKNKTIKFEECPVTEDIPDLESVKENTPPKEVIKIVEEESLPDDDTSRNEENEQEKKKLRRRKKKQNSEDPEEGKGGRRIVICDDQIDIENLRSVGRASEVLSTSLLGTTQTGSGFGDFLVVSELGSGIFRGSMNYGRLYQGKYIPPERTDGLLPECEEEQSAIENANIEEMTEEDTLVPTDIGLD